MEEYGTEGFMAVFIVVLLVVLVVALAVYIVTSIFLNKLNKKIYGKGTALAWIPYAKTFLLGKLAFNKLIGLIYLGVTIFVEIMSGATSDSSASGFFSGISSLLGIATIVLYVFAIMRNSKLSKGELSPEALAVECDSMEFPKGDKNTAPANPAPVNVEPNNNPPVVNNQPAPVETKTCPDCGTALDANSTFCTNCGKQL